MSSNSVSPKCAVVMSSLIVAVCSSAGLAEGDRYTVKARVQARPGGPVVETEMAVHEVPTDLPSVPAAEATLADDDLVLGVVVAGSAKAFPIRYLAMHEVIDDLVGGLPVAPTW